MQQDGFLQVHQIEKSGFVTSDLKSSDLNKEIPVAFYVNFLE